MYQIFKELEALVEDGGLTPDVDTLTQVRDAVRALVAGSTGLDTTAGDARYLRRGQNLGDVNNRGTSRGNLSAAPLASPTFTGNPRAPTPSVGDDDTSIATTEFVDECDRQHSRRPHSRDPQRASVEQSADQRVGGSGLCRWT